MVTAKRSILVVDDEPDTCANLADIFTDLGYQVDVAYDGESALELVRQRAYDVALLDLRMPGMDGLELYRRIKLLSSGTVAILVTAYASDATAAAALQAGAWRILPKPANLQRLIAMVEEAAGQPLIMVVDDDTDLCESLWDLFREHGFRVSIARNLKEAAERLRDASLQVALIDMKLPEGDGLQVFQLLREANPRARAILITGHRGETEPLVGQVLSAGAEGVCYKPFDVEKLLESVKKLAK